VVECPLAQGVAHVGRTLRMLGVLHRRAAGAKREGRAWRVD
jgi:hypothetical protein